LWSDIAVMDRVGVGASSITGSSIEEAKSRHCFAAGVEIAL